MICGKVNMAHSKADFKITFNGDVKRFTSPDYNYTFNLKNGDMAILGKTLEETPNVNPYGPEIADVEITTVCDGGCKFCYKANTPNGTNMSFETFKTILDKFPTDASKNYAVNQIAFGVDAHATSNPDLWKMMEYCRSVNIIPNLTVADISEETAQKIVGVAGACSVSAYKHMKNFETCFDSIAKLTDIAFADESEGMQINIHYMLASESVDDAYYIMDAIKTDPRLKHVNALVFLGLKQKGLGVGYNICPDDKFKEVLDYAFKNGIQLGFDTCLACRVMNYLDNCNLEHAEAYKQSIETCCGGRISAYVGVDGNYFPCSFLEYVGKWTEGINMLEVVDFCEDVWHNKRVVDFANSALTCAETGTGCPYWEV